ncbi:BgTH12-01172 [Blumeria graminis f. sp. triticale]|uniref:BgtA-21209 n=3 Tax=Blumeria graminis TaxID=34373 RepID=A0A9X9MNG3_BLUGR|nr:hypothetical protein BGT96224_A21209 [Blumeria graminis f. sp. tritici 96224]CAD6505682.1 BgTH12-01172 [Blumeria graminis f. sp. triticale]VDB93844.1 BgtA-21209 [Blumeria graminis f. sp. tritici]
MTTSVTINSQVKSDVKAPKNKKAMNAATLDQSNSKSDIQSNTKTGPEEASSNDIADNSNIVESAYESPYLRELQKSIRNINKKISNASRVDNIVAENPEKTLDELVASRKINADQKAQILKKPALQASLAQLEEQVSQYMKFDHDFKTRYQEEKAIFEKNLKEQASRELQDAITTTKSEAQETAAKELEDSLLLLSKFLKLAAIRRAEEEVAELNESKALEGLLAQVYSGDSAAVAAMLNLINGSEKTLKSVSGEDLDTTYATLRAASLAQVPYADVDELLESDEVVKSSEYTVQGDPTIIHAGLTETDANTDTALTNGNIEPSGSQGIIRNSGFGNEATNAAAEHKLNGNSDLSQSQEWIKLPSVIPTESSETDSSAAHSKVQSWADDRPESPADAPSIAPPAVDDGFREIQRSRGGRGNRAGRGDGYRGRGNYRGDGYRGRGRNGGNSRGGRRGDE